MLFAEGAGSLTVSPSSEIATITNGVSYPKTHLEGILNINHPVRLFPCGPLQMLPGSFYI